MAEFLKWYYIRGKRLRVIAIIPAQKDSLVVETDGFTVSIYRDSHPHKWTGIGNMLKSKAAKESWEFVSKHKRSLLRELIQG